jgi:rfaE bifunctional protein nucleotidyltransferase chain/domain
MYKTWSETSKRKIIDPKDLKAKVAEIRKSGKSIGTINGSFDLLHAGHLYILHQASQTADCLIVALNSDSSIKQYKSVDRPIITLPYRLQMMAALEFVDYVTWFDETDPRAILEIIRPDVHSNGAYYGEDCIEAGVVKTHGGRIHLIEHIDGLSTTQIVKKIIALTEKEKEKV